MTTTPNKPQDREEGGLVYSYIELGRKTEVETVKYLQNLTKSPYGMVELRLSGEQEHPLQIFAFETTNQTGVVHSLGAEFEETINFEEINDLYEFVGDFGETEHYGNDRFIVKADDMNPQQLHVFRVKKETKIEGIGETVRKVLAVEKK